MSSDNGREDSVVEAVTAWHVFPQPQIYLQGTEGSLGDRLRHRGTGDEKAYLINDAEQPAAEGHQVVGKQGALQASASIIKAVVGAGSFALPWAFLQAGLFGGMIGILVLAILSCYTIRMLIQCKRELVGKSDRYVTYVDIAREVYGRVVAWTLYAAIVITSIGACSAYLVFWYYSSRPSACHPLFTEPVPCPFSGNMLESVSRGKLESMYWVFILAGPLILFTWIRSFRYLAFTSIIGDIALVLAMITMFVEGFKEESVENPFGGEYPPIQYLSYPKFFGAAAFLFCVHMLMVPIEQSMHTPKNFGKAVYGSFLVVTVLNLVFAAIGYEAFDYKYMLYKGATKDIIINNLPDNVFVDVARVALVFDLFFTFIVVIVPARDIIETSLLTPNQRWNTIKRYAIRTVMVGICVGIGVGVKQFSDLIGLVSGLSLSFMAFVLPPMLHMRLFWARLDWVLIGVDIFLILFGIVAAVTTTTVSAISIVGDYS
ncbi:Transmembrane amino acid transporter protein [Acanthamoeba castellanii str. Neff]|uniref:Transmembrane amino acid transporter protein n=1 Tax=Acanthamoeba castellanii (strain ATCC 30010 / Neff) TaxID=1257118 RepID=L8HFY8_ACACF|nr:Transmembrane amino acid transporter protein [Acanthamoeba castellanii str. Neff]ELR24157.1 Transmembrane amino acid transporter protein [Acanthamoeba castellanii str. Neff]